MSAVSRTWRPAAGMCERLAYKQRSSVASFDFSMVTHAGTAHSTPAPSTRSRAVMVTSPPPNAACSSALSLVLWAQLGDFGCGKSYTGLESWSNTCLRHNGRNAACDNLAAERVSGRRSCFVVFLLHFCSETLPSSNGS